MLSSRFLRLSLLAVLALALAPSRDAAAQPLTPRFGLGFETMLHTDDGLGFGFRGRASAPVNADLSFAVDLGVLGYVLEGRDDATVVFDPQVSAIVTLPRAGRRAPYFLAGIGAYLPLSETGDKSSGPSLHGGLGWVRVLSETTVFYEVNPALVIGRESVQVAIPFRVGFIF